MFPEAAHSSMQPRVLLLPHLYFDPSPFSTFLCHLDFPLITKGWDLPTLKWGRVQESPSSAASDGDVMAVKFLARLDSYISSSPYISI